MSEPQREARVVDAIARGASKIRDISAACGSDLTTTGIALRRLHEAGVLVREPNPDWTGGKDKAPLYLWRLA